MNYYNEFDPKIAAWLEQLIKDRRIPDGYVDTRSITEVKPVDLVGYTQCHFFAGIGGWILALELAGWSKDRPVWTGSCPCQPFSTAGKRKGAADERHLWPEFFRLIKECRPDVVFGEQVENAIRLGWLDGVCADLEKEGYAVGSVVLGAHSVNAPHRRQRLYWVADSCKESGKRGTRGFFEKENRGERSREFIGDMSVGYTDGLKDRDPVGLADSNEAGSQGRIECSGGSREWVAGPDGSRLADPKTSKRGWLPEENSGGRKSKNRRPVAWNNYELIGFTDGKTRRIESGLMPLAHGVPSRVVQISGYGNAIVPQVAAEFVKAYCEW